MLLNNQYRNPFAKADYPTNWAAWLDSQNGVDAIGKFVNAFSAAEWISLKCKSRSSREPEHLWRLAAVQGIL
ncbi:hypothetical protein [Rhizobium sp. F40D2]